MKASPSFTLMLIVCLLALNGSALARQQGGSNIVTVAAQLSEQISSTMLAENKSKVAVMSFPLLTGETTELGLYLTEKITIGLFKYKDKFEVVERKQLASIFEEMKRVDAGVIDDETVKSIGRIAGADVLVVGTITDLGAQIDINLRVLGTERANVLAVASSFLAKDDAIRRLLGHSLAPEERAANDTESDERTDPVNAGPPLPKFQNKYFSITIDALTSESRSAVLSNPSRSGKRLVALVTFKNVSDEPWSIMVDAGSTYLLDKRGARWTTPYAGKGFSVMIEPGLILSFPIEFEPNGDEDGSTFTVFLSIKLFRGRLERTSRGFSAVIRNVKLGR